MKCFTGLILCMLMFLNFSAQEKLSWEKELELISNYYLQDTVRVNLTYTEKKRDEGSSNIIGGGLIAMYKSQTHVIFDEYEMLNGPDFYVKIDHSTKELFVIKHQENRELVEQFTPWKFDATKLKQYALSFDSTRSNPMNGKLVFTGQSKSNYENLIFTYSPTSKQMLSYKISFKSNVSKEVESLTIDFRERTYVKQESRLFLISNFFIINNNGEIEVNKNYKSYALVKNI